MQICHFEYTPDLIYKCSSKQPTASPIAHRATQLFISYFNYAIYASYKLILHISSLYTETQIEWERAINYILILYSALCIFVVDNASMTTNIYTHIHTYNTRFMLPHTQKAMNPYIFIYNAYHIYVYDAYIRYNIHSRQRSG